MSGRTCLFCGKPLWRIRGGNGDFCSPGHRNQYQLRKGINQILEADKVSAIGRRREAPNLQALLKPAGAAPETRRSFVWKNPVSERVSGPRYPLSRFRSHAHLAAQEPAQIVAPANTGTIAARRVGPVPMQGRSRPAIPTRRSRQGNVGRTSLVANAGALPAARALKPTIANPRLVSRLWSPEHEVAAPHSPGVRSILRSGMQAPRERRLKQSPWSRQMTRVSCGPARPHLRAPELPTTEPTGTDLEMPIADYSTIPLEVIEPESEKCGFDAQFVPPVFQFVRLEDRCIQVTGSGRLPERPTPFEFSVEARAGVQRRATGRLHPVPGKPVLSALGTTLSAPKNPALTGGGTVRVTAPEAQQVRHDRVTPPRVNWAAPPINTGRVHGPSQPSLTGRPAIRPQAIPADVVRGARARELAPAHVRLPGAAKRYLASAHPAAMGGGAAIRDAYAPSVTVRPLTIATAVRTAQTAAPVQDLLYEPPELEPRGKLEDVLETETPPPARLEENFSSGLARWTSGVSDWKVDIAGVRTGSLALFKPSLEWRDYDLEFLAKMEGRGMTWVVRAADLNNYYMLRITLPPRAGAGILQRWSVIGGAAAEPVTVPLPPGIKSRAALTVLMNLRGSEFSVLLDGSRIDQWTDDRLAAGGIGFQADGENRTRLYWVKLAASASRAMKER